MRNTFGKWFNEETQPDVNKLLSGDIGFGVFDELRKSRPNDFINMGIAEQNMIGFAVGLSQSNFIPWVYTIIPFLIFRPFEFIRNIVCYDNSNVKLVGIGAGLVYDNLGYTHYGIEDISIISQLLSIRILTPYSPNNVIVCSRLALNHTGPVYLRLGKGSEDELISDEEIPGASIFNKKSEDKNNIVICYGAYLSIILESYENFPSKVNLPLIIAVYDVDSFSLENFKYTYSKIIYFEEQRGSGFKKLYDIIFEFSNDFIKYDLNCIDFKAIGKIPPDRKSILELAKLDSYSISKLF